MSTPEDPHPTDRTPGSPEGDRSEESETPPERFGVSERRPDSGGEPPDTSSESGADVPTEAWPTRPPEDAPPHAWSARSPEDAPARTRPEWAPEDVPTEAWSAQSPEDVPTQAWSPQFSEGTPPPEPSAQSPEDVPTQAWSERAPEDVPTQAWSAGPSSDEPGREGSRPSQPPPQLGGPVGPAAGASPHHFSAEAPKPPDPGAREPGWPGSGPPTRGPAPGESRRGPDQPGGHRWGPGQPGTRPPGGAYGYPPPPGAAGGRPEWQGQQPWQGGEPGYGAPEPGPGGGFPSYPQQSYEPYGETEQRRSGAQVFSIIAFVCAVISLLFCPILFGPAGIVLGLVGHSKGESLGKWAAIAAGVGLVTGLALGILVYNADVVPTS